MIVYLLTTNKNTVDPVTGVVTEVEGDPIYGGRLVIGPAVSQLLAYTDDATQSNWIKNAGITVAQYAGAGYSGAPGGFTMRATDNSSNNQKYIYQSVSVTSGVTYEFAAEVEADGLDYAFITPGTSGFTYKTTFQNFNITTGALATGGGGNFASITPVRGYPGRFLIRYRATATSTGAGFFILGFLATDVGFRTPSWTAANTTDGIIVHRCNFGPYVPGKETLRYAGATPDSRAADSLSYAVTVPQAAGMAIIELGEPLSETAPGHHGLISFDGSTRVGPAYRDSSGTTVVTGDGTNTGTVTLGTDATAIAARWIDTAMQIGVRGASGWTWGTEATYDGGFADDSVLSLGQTLAEFMSIYGFAVYEDDRGTAWIEANYPLPTTPAVTSVYVVPDGDQVQFAFNMAHSGAIGFSLTVDASPMPLTNPTWNAAQTLLTFDTDSVIGNTAVCTADLKNGLVFASNGQQLADFADAEVNNGSGIDDTPPLFVGASVNVAGDSISFTFDSVLSAAHTTGLSITADAVSKALSNYDVVDNVITADCAQIYNGQAVEVAFTQGNIQDTSGNLLANFSATSTGVSNLSQEPVPDVTAPTILSATISTDGSTLTVVADEDCLNTPGFTLRRTQDGQAVSLLPPVLTGDTWVWTPVQAYDGQVFTLEYAPPATGFITDLAGNPLAAFTGAAVTNNSTVANPTLFSEDYSDGVDNSGGTATRAGAASAVGADGDQVHFAEDEQVFETRHGKQYALFEKPGERLNDNDAKNWNRLGTGLAVTDSGTLCGEPAFNLTGQTATWNRARPVNGLVQTGTYSFRVVLGLGEDGGGLRNQAVVRVENTSQANASTWATITLGADPVMTLNPSCGDLTFLRKAERTEGVAWEYDFNFVPHTDGHSINYGLGTGTASAIDSIRFALGQVEEGDEPTSWIPGDGANQTRAGTRPSDTGGLQYSVADLETVTLTATVMDADGIDSTDAIDTYVDYDAPTDVLKVGGSGITRLRSLVSSGTVAHTYQTTDPATTTADSYVDRPMMGMQYAAKIKNGARAAVTNTTVLASCRDQYCRLSLKDVMTGYDSYSWTLLDSIINTAWAQSPRKTTFLCIIMGTPFIDTNEYQQDKPQWFLDALLAGSRGLSGDDTSCDYYVTRWTGWSSGDPNATYTGIIQPCHDSEIFLSMVERFLTAFAAHYGTDEWAPKISGVDIRFQGAWSEWHTSNVRVLAANGSDAANHTWPLGSQAAQERVIDAHVAAYLASGKRLNFCANFDNGNNYNGPYHPWDDFATQIAAIENGRGGWGQDGIGSTRWEIITRVMAYDAVDNPNGTGWSLPCAKAFRRGGVRAEPQSGSGLTLDGDLVGTTYTPLTTCFDYMEEQHTNWWNNKYSQLYATSSSFRALVDAFNNDILGYRFYATDAYFPDTCVADLQFDLALQLHNTNCGVFDHDFLVDLCFKFVKQGGGASDVICVLDGGITATIKNEPQDFTGLGTISTAGTWDVYVGFKMKPQFDQAAWAVPLAHDAAIQTTDGNGQQWTKVGETTVA